MKLLDQKQPEIVKTAETLCADKAYDDTELITVCWDEYQIKPVIDLRNMWKDPDETRLLTGKENVVYNYKGDVYCYCHCIFFRIDIHTAILCSTNRR